MVKQIEDDKLIFLLKSNQENSIPKTINILKRLINQNNSLCIYITFNKPSKVLQKTFKSKGVNTNKILFIDAITRLSEDVDFEKNFIYVDSPQELTTISTVIRNRLELSEDIKNKFVFIDSLSNIITYNSTGNTIKFMQSLTNKLRLIEIKGKILVIKGGVTKETTIEEFGKFVDQIIEL